VPAHLPDRTPVLEGDRVVLRPARSDDVEDRRLLGTDPEIQRMYGAVPVSEEWKPIDEPAARTLVDWVREDPNPLHWVVEHGGRFLGTARLRDVQLMDERARYAVGLEDRSLLGQGLGTEVTRLVLAYGFEQVGLHRIDLRVLAYNLRAIACYRRCGFVEEGRERDAALVGTERHDDVIMSILRPDWPPHPEVPRA
jgi:ribosomal-protein-alanine N-acetyltransferase